MIESTAASVPDVRHILTLLTCRSLKELWIIDDVMLKRRDRRSFIASIHRLTNVYVDVDWATIVTAGASDKCGGICNRQGKSGDDFKLVKGQILIAFRDPRNYNVLAVPSK
ncbi:hypothetical protein IFM53868_07041 [Aspergillus udagawae]|uniref:Heterokaryon incompatibility domain-containing protein n=1 Tax=Aspergillus udagawae TaxID=91492 RepID=A0ABQ1B3D6_9EURO|nr:hypothetical protein IFM53868_07041 [Aspergillus udagawae]